MNKELDDLLKFDPLAEAEKITGTSYKEDELTSYTGMALMQLNNERKSKLLEESNDSGFSNKIGEYLEIVCDFGFELLLREALPKKEEYQDYIYVLWHSEYSILLSFDSYWGDESVNSGKFYYNIEFNEGVERWNLTSSGGFYAADGSRNFDDGDKLVWCGDHDCREAIKHNINNLAENGEFKETWAHNPIFCLTGYSETPRDMDHKESMKIYDQITNDRISRLPKEVQNKINGVVA